MYICNKCDNKEKFEEINVVKTYINQNIDDENCKDEKFLYREDVVCSKCGALLSNGKIIEISK